MKLNTITTFAVFLFSSASAFAGGNCPRTGDNYICAGDTVIDTEDGWSGTVMGANPWSNQVSVRWTSDARGFARYQMTSLGVRNLAVNSGCLGRVCVGDRVYDTDSGWSGVVKGVNPHNNKAAVLFDSDKNGFGRYQMESKYAPNLSVERGCLRGFCVGDQVFDMKDGWSGTVKAISKRSGLATVLWTSDSRGFARHQRSSLSVSGLSNSRFCADYSHTHRSQDYYIPYPSGYSNPVRLENPAFDRDSYYTVRGNY